MRLLALGSFLTLACFNILVALGILNMIVARIIEASDILVDILIFFVVLLVGCVDEVVFSFTLVGFHVVDENILLFELFPLLRIKG
jgi:hypothetical protein